MKNLVSLVVVGIKNDQGRENVRFFQYHDDSSGEDEYKILYENENKERNVTKEVGNDLYREIIKNAIYYLKIV